MELQNISFEKLELLPQTRDFFESRNSKAIPVFIACMFVMLAGFFVWASIAKMDDVVKAQAVIRPVDTISSVRVMTTGKISAKKYSQNQKVMKGDVLIRFDDTVIRTELENTELLFSQYQKEQDETKLLLNVLENGSGTVPEISSNPKYQAYSAEYSKLKTSVALAEKEYYQQSNAPDTLQVPQKIEESRIRLEQTKLSFESWKKTQLIQTKDSVNSIEQNLKSLETKIVSLKQSLKDTEIFAPIDGIIDEVIPVNVGDYAIASTEILKIIPDTNETLKAEIIVDASKIPRIKENQVAKLRFPGLPPSTFGQVESRISEIPADMTVTNGNPVFQIETVIDNPYLESKQGEKIHLRPGIIAEARIVISRDTILKMILRKLDFVH